jgi:hypothetical protein
MLCRHNVTVQVLNSLLNNSKFTFFFNFRCAVSENCEELSLDTFQRCEVMELKTGNKKQEKIVKLRSTHSKATAVCLLQHYW